MEAGHPDPNDKPAADPDWQWLVVSYAPVRCFIARLGWKVAGLNVCLRACVSVPVLSHSGSLSDRPIDGTEDLEPTRLRDFCSGSVLKPVVLCCDPNCLYRISDGMQRLQLNREMKHILEVDVLCMLCITWRVVYNRISRSVVWLVSYSVQDTNISSIDAAFVCRDPGYCFSTASYDVLEFFMKLVK